MFHVEHSLVLISEVRVTTDELLLLPNQTETRTVIVSILQMLRSQAEYMHRQHGWMIAIAETLRDEGLTEKLEQQPFYDQGPRPDVKITDTMIRNIDALIQELSHP